MNVPLPKRPGTLYRPKSAEPGCGAVTCEHCGQDWGHHGADEITAAALDVPLAKRTHICPASTEAWTEYWRQAQRSTVEGFIVNVRNDLKKFNPEERALILGTLLGDL